MRKLILTVCTLVALNAANAQDFKHSVSLFEKAKVRNIHCRK